MTDINICFATDDKYAPYMGVALQSALASAAKTDFLRFHILDNGISAENKKAIASLKTLYPNHEVCFYPLDPQWLKDLPLVHETLSVVAYARLWLGRVLPPQVSRVIYLDCDVFVRGSLAVLYEEGLGDNVVAGVEDIGVMEKARAGAHPWPWKENVYINSGVLLIDVARWRKENTERVLLDYLYHPSYPLQFEDQDVINFSLRGQIKQLWPGWNGQVYWGNSAWDHSQGIASLRRTLETCPIIHFATPVKPWYTNSGWHTGSQQYRQLMASSPWARHLQPIGTGEIIRRFFNYLFVHPCCLFKPRFYRNFYWEGVCLFR